MEVREASAAYKVSMGFKQTEIGLLPNDWMIIPLEAEFEVQLGKMLDAAKNSGDDKPFIGNRAVQWGRIEISDIGLIKLKSSELSRFRLKKGDLLVCEGGEVGRCAIWDEQLSECYFQKALHRLRPKNGYNVNLLANVLRLYSVKGFLANYVTQTSIAHLPKDKFQSIPIPLPPTRQEQDAIAEALSDADALIESLSLLLFKKCQIKHGAMQELLTGKKRLPGFRAPWVEIALGSIGKTYGGLTGKSKVDFGQGQARYVTFMNVMNNTTIDPELTEPVNVLTSEAQNIVSMGDWLFNGSSETPEEVAFCSYVAHKPGQLYLNSFCFGFRPHDVDSICGLFMAYFFRSKSGRQAISALAQGATRYNISKAALLRVPLLLPPVEEQRAIAEVLSDLDSDITAAESRLAKAHDIKRGMMQVLLTGRIRLAQPASNVIQLPIKLAIANPSTSQFAHNWQINEAVVIGVLAQRFGNEKFPLPRKRRVKLMYLLHRHAEGRAEGYLKKAAGPYDPDTKYKGPEAIALKNGYVQVLGNDKYEGFVAGDKIEQAQRYFEQWYGTAALEWLEQFHYRKTDDLELLATVDMAMVDMATLGKPVDVAGIKRVIATHPEWVPKLSRALFSDDNIASAITECQVLFNG